MAEEARVTATVDVRGLDQAVDKFARLGSTASEARAATSAGRFEYQLGTAQRLTQELRTGQLGPAEIENLLSRARSARAKADAQADDILQSGQAAIRRFHSMLERGQYEPGALRRAVATGLPGAEYLRQLPSVQREGESLEQLIRRLEVLQQRGGDQTAEKQASAVGGVFQRYLPQFGRVVTTALGIVGIGGLFATLGQIRGTTKEFLGYTADTVLGLGLGRGGSQQFENEALGSRAFAVQPRTAAEIEAALVGGYGRAGVGRAGVGRFAGLGLGFGMGREGFANMAEQMSMTAFMPGQQGMAEAENFGRLTFGAAEAGGLTRQQRQFYLESNRNLIELFTRFTGGQPLNVTEFVTQMEGLRRSVSGLGLAGGGMPQLRGAVEAAASLVPMGQPLGGILRTGLLAGFSMEQAQQAGGGDIRMGMTKLLTEAVQPTALPGFFRQLAGEALGRRVEPGHQFTGAEMQDIGVWLQDAMGSSAMGTLLQTPGGQRLFQSITGVGPGQQIGDLGAEGNRTLAELQKTFEGMAGGRMLSVDAQFIRDGIDQWGRKLIDLESTLKEYLGPTGAIVASILATGLMGMSTIGAGLLVSGGLGAAGYSIYQRMFGRGGGGPTKGMTPEEAQRWEAEQAEKPFLERWVGPRTAPRPKDLPGEPEAAQGTTGLLGVMIELVEALRDNSRKTQESTNVERGKPEGGLEGWVGPRSPRKMPDVKGEAPWY